ncbi:MAG: hypothetical protein RLZ70_1311 [Verrucomicrobiota bacterium]
MQQGRPEVGILGYIAAAAGVALADPARAMDVDLVETALVRLVLRLVAEMPFAEDAGAVAGLLQLLGQGRRAERQALALEDGVGDAVLELMPPGQQRATRGGAGRRDLEIREADAFGAEPVEVRGLEHRVAVRAHVAVALVVRQDEEDVRAIGGVDDEREQQAGKEAHRGDPKLVSPGGDSRTNYPISAPSMTPRGVSPAAGGRPSRSLVSTGLPGPLLSLDRPFHDRR